MRADLDAALVRDFPHLYRMRNAPKQDTCMCWGFPGAGWEPLIRRLSEKLERMILAEPDRVNFYADQVKEKLGGLRFYMPCESDAMHEAIKEAEAEAWRTCEECGGEGKRRGSSWLRVRCDRCDKGNKSCLELSGNPL